MNQPVLLIVIPLLLAFLSIAIKKASKVMLFAAVISNIALSFFVEYGEYYIGGFKAPFGINLHVDAYAWYAVIIINSLFFLSLVIGRELVNKYATVLLVILAALNGLLLTGDLFNLFVFIEIASIGAYLLVSMNKKYVHTFHYLVLGTIGSALYLLGVVFLYVMYGTLNMGKMHDLMVSQGISVYLPILLIFAGLAVEIKILPFNSWVKGILGNSNRFTGVMVASIYSGTMLAVFGRLFNDVFILSENMKFILSIIAVLTILAGEFAAFNSKKLREVLLYSSIAQSGLVVVLFVNGLATAAVLVILGNVVAKMILFTIAGTIAEEESDAIDSLRGIFKKRFVLGIGFTVAAMSLAGLPLFFGLFVKLNVLISLFTIGNLWIPIIVLVAALIEGAYFIQILVKLWNPGQEGTAPAEAAQTSFHINSSVTTGIIIAALSLLLVITGLVPGYVVNKAEEAADTLSVNESVEIPTIEGGVLK